MLITEVDITVQAGTGGDGRSSFMTFGDKSQDGGDGGQGGDVYLKGTTNIQALNRFTNETDIIASSGSVGETGKRPGLKGKDLTIKLPIGAIVHDKKSGFKREITDTKKRIKIANGGRGGRGNFSFRYHKKFPLTYFEKGIPGTKLELFIELKLMADYGLIGFPNAGKSSLLNELTRTKAKVAGYPFTTIEPNVGSLGDKVIADIPGLIEGASEGRGLGHKFLKHVEKVSLLLHCVPADSQDISNDYEVITKEINKFNSSLGKKDKLIILTKTDMVTPEELQEKKKILEQYGYPVLATSIHDWDSLEELKKNLK